MILIHDVETLNGLSNVSSGVEKQSFQQQVNKQGYKASSSYKQRRFVDGLVQGQMILGTHDGLPLDYGISVRHDENVNVNM